MTLNYDNKKFKTVKHVYNYITKTYPSEEMETKCIDFMNTNYGDLRPAVHNQKLSIIFANHPELYEKHMKRSSKKVKKIVGGKVLNNINEVCKLIVSEAKDKDDYNGIPAIVANIFDDGPEQFASKLAHIRYKKKLMELLRKEAIPEEVKKQLKLHAEDIKEYAKYQNDKQKEYYAKKQAIQPESTQVEA